MQNAFDVAALTKPSLISISEPVTATKSGSIALDTTFVLFFLALEIGRSGVSFSFESLLSLLTVTGFALLPYVLPFSGDKEGFAQWAIGRGAVAAIGISLGIMLDQAIGPLLPHAAKFVPMTLLIVAAIISCNVQLYGIIRFRLAR